MKLQHITFNKVNNFVIDITLNRDIETGKMRITSVIIDTKTNSNVGFFRKNTDDLIGENVGQFAYDVWRSAQPVPAEYPELVAKFMADGISLANAVPGTTLHAAKQKYEANSREIMRLIDAIHELVG